MSRSCLLVLAACVCRGALTFSIAAPNTNTPSVTLALFNTGVGNDGALLPDGALDSHYQLVQSPDSTFPGPDAWVALSSGWPYPQWHADGPESKWISPRADVAAGNAGGIYVYRTLVDLTGLDPHTARIEGQWATDNDGLDILLNGISTGNQNFLGFDFGAFAPFALQSGFKSGTNTVDFVVHQAGAGTPTGLRVELNGTARLPCTVCDPPLPMVSILSPIDGTAFCPGSNIVVTLAASAEGDDIAQVELYTGTTRVGSVSAPPYTFTLSSLEVGNYLVWARAVDSAGRSTDSSAVRVVVTATCRDTIGVIASRDDPQLSVVQNWLLDLGLRNVLVEPAALTIEATRDWKALVWLASRGVTAPLTPAAWAVLEMATAQGVGTYHCGEGFATSLTALSDQGQSDWSNLLHMQPRPGSGGAGEIQFVRDTPVHPVVQGMFGTSAVEDFPATLPLAGAATSDAQVIARLNGSDVVVTFPAGSDGDDSVARTVTQFVDVSTGTDDFAGRQRKQLFQNAIYWLLDWAPCSLYSLKLNSALSGPASVGSVVTYTLQVQHEGECEATGVVVTQPLSPALQFLGADYSQGACEPSPGLVTFRVGHLSSAAAAHFRIRVLAVGTGDVTNCASVYSDGYPSGIAMDSCTALQIGPGMDPKPALTFQGLAGAAQLALRGAPGLEYAIESSKDLRLWTAWTNTVLTLPSQTWDQPANAPQRFYRAFVVDAPAQGAVTTSRSSP